MTRGELHELLNQARASRDHALWTRALKASGDWIAEHGWDATESILGSCRWITEQFEMDRILGNIPFPLQMDEAGNFTIVDEHGIPIPEEQLALEEAEMLAELAEPSPPPRITLTVDPQYFPNLLVYTIEVARETTLEFEIPMLESIKPRDGLWIQGQDRHAAADLIAHALAQLDIPVTRTET